LAGRLWVATAPLGAWLLAVIRRLLSFGAGLLYRLQGLVPYRALAHRLVGRRVRYRLAIQDDAPALSTLYGYGNMPELEDPLDTWIGQLADLEGRGCAPVAILGGKIVGATVLRRAQEETGPSADWWIWGMRVAGHYRGAGIGQGLACQALQAAREGGAGAVYLRVFGHNRPALNLYRKVGFRPAPAGDDGPERHLEIGGTLWVYRF
jgi:RimJ/RimL family protein N-acetyltransferase